MAIVNVTERLGGGTGDKAESGVISYTRLFTVTTDDADDDASVVLAATGLPAASSTYASGNGSDANAIARTFSARRLSRGPKAWEVTVGYMPVETTSEGPEPSDPTNVEDWLPRISISQASYSEPSKFDANGNPICNSAGEPFEPWPQKDANRPRITITRNEISPDWFLYFSLIDSLNADIFSFFNPGLCKMSGITGESAVYDDGSTRFRYYSVSYHIDVKTNGWQLEILDEGFMELAEVIGGNVGGTDNPGPVGAPKIFILGKLGVPVRKKHGLDGLGKKLGDGADPVTLNFNMYPKRLWAGLQLPPLNFNLGQ